MWDGDFAWFQSFLRYEVLFRGENEPDCVFSGRFGLQQVLKLSVVEPFPAGLVDMLEESI